MFDYYKDIVYTNLLEETRNILKEYDKYETDIKYVRVKNIRTGEYVYVSWESFKNTIKGYNYDNGYGEQYVWKDLRVVLYNEEYLKRREYDGSEWWEYICKPPMNVVITEYNPEEMGFCQWQPTS